MEKVKIIYILGSGHSGTTMLEILLSHHPQAISIGEAWVLPKRLTTASHVVCACGVPFSECEFWTKTSETWKAALTTDVKLSRWT